VEREYLERQLVVGQHLERQLLVGEQLVGEQLVGEHVVREHMERELVVGQLVVWQHLERRRLVVGRVELTPAGRGLARRRPSWLAAGPRAGGATIWLYDCALVAAAVSMWVAVLRGTNAQPILRLDVPWWAFALVFFLTEAYVVHVPFRRQAYTISLSEVGLVLGLYVLSPALLLIATLAGAAAALVFARRQRPSKLVFNLAQLALTTSVALIVFRSVADLGNPFGGAGWGGVLLAVVASSIVGIILVTVAIALAEGPLELRRLLVAAGISFVASVAVANLMLIAIELTRVNRASILLLAVPAAIAVLTFRAFAAQAKRHEHLEFLYDSMKATHGASEFSLAVGQLLIAVRQLVRAEFAEILLFPTGVQPGLRTTLGPDGGSTTHLDTVDPSAAAARAELEAGGGAVLLPAGRALQPLHGYLAERSLPDGIVAPLRGEEGIFGILVVGLRSGNVDSFDGEDRLLLETFVGHASVMLENGRLERSLAEVTDLKERLRHQAFHDVLTGLPNRALFTERVEAALEHGSGAAAVLFMDLDDFKTINDTLGHAVGDEVLAEVGRRVQRAVRPTDTAARLGGDEFAVLLDSIDRHGTEVVAESLLKTMRRPFALSGREVRLNTSIGIAPASTVRTADELLRNADVAMYTAKQSGKHCFAHYDPSMHAKVRKRHEFALGLEKALERNQIGVVFEPIVEMRHGRIVAFEALARWHSPERGVVPPGEFLPVAEEIGLMNEIGDRVLRLACREAHSWQERHPDFRDVAVSVNLSPSELSMEELARRIACALRDTELPASTLMLEITESDVMRDLDSAHLRMEELRSLGVQLVLDDFGTGRSSLERLVTFPLDALKIAKPFVDRLLDPRAESGFIDTFVRLAGSLGIMCIAEGVEEPSQVAHLIERGATLGQGYHFARPMRPDELEAYLGPATTPLVRAG
jgi:diguanylate cyclase (GGDEF)-like protein